MSPVNTSNDSQPFVQQLLGMSKAYVRHRVWLISAIVEIYLDGSIGVLFREHCRRRWSDAYVIAG